MTSDRENSLNLLLDEAFEMFISERFRNKRKKKWGVIK